MKNITTFGVKPTSNPVAVGIDQSYGGFAITILNIPPDGNFYTAVAKAPASVSKGVVRLLTLREFLSDTLSGLDIKDVAMEGYAYSSTMGHTMGELGGMVKLYLYEELGITPLQVPPATLKKYICGKGTGIKKNQILLNVYKKWGVEFTDDNAADSYGLAQIAAKYATVQYEKDVLKTLSDPKFRGI